MKGLVINNFSFDRESINTLKSMDYNNYPIVYILHDNKKKKSAYIGQTVQMRNRMKAHLKDEKKKGLDSVLLIAHENCNEFN
ncbi:GIY-YIG nuclease family protein [Salinicoccus sp. HZC-1]|uniref:GIY-YIG nuclease family protein n=1 Tax=Salinicoccus sp. HZC-1 TaxID=3385497 RepID=UPI00398B8C99